MSETRILTSLAVAVLCFSTAANAADFSDKQTDVNSLPNVPAAFEVTLFAREPQVRQPCSMAAVCRHGTAVSKSDS